MSHWRGPWGSPEHWKRAKAGVSPAARSHYFEMWTSEERSVADGNLSMSAFDVARVSPAAMLAYFVQMGKWGERNGVRINAKQLRPSPTKFFGIESLVGQGARQRNAVGLFVSKSQRGNRVGPGSHLLRKSHLKLRNTPPDNGLRIGQDLTGSERTEQEVNPEGAPMLGLSFTRSRLFIDCASSQYDEAEYTCVAQNPYHRISKSTKVKVTKIGSAHSSPLCLVKKSFVAPGVPARITMWTHTRLELMGSTVQLFCRPIGSPKPSVSWFGPDDTELQNSDKYKVLENGDLEIRNIAWNDMGGYTCTAENSHGVDRTSTFLYPTLPDKV
ncbi:hypothetical protein MRX96_058512 [Rhipicephalus microplus]